MATPFDFLSASRSETELDAVIRSLQERAFLGEL